MANVPVYFRFFIDDYLRDAEELSMTKHGAYLRLMLWYYARAKPIPDDLLRIYQRVGARSAEEEGAVRWVLEEFFQLREGFWYHKRIEDELTNWRARSESAKTSVEAREKKRLQNNDSGTSNDDRTIIERSSNQNQNQNHIKTKSKALSGSQANADAIRLLELLNQKTNRKFRVTKATLQPIIARLGEFTFEECRGVIIQRCKKWGSDPVMSEYLRPDTLFRPTKFAQYVADVPTPEEIHDANKILP